MAARFYEGASIKVSRSLNQQGKTPAVQKNSMKGLPGYIKTTQDRSSGGLASSKPVGPRFTVGTSLKTTKETRALRSSQGAEIGTRAKPGDKHYTGKYADNGKFRGSSDKSYRATSTGPAGKITSTRNGAVANRAAKESEGPKRGKPTRGAKIAGVHSANRFSASGAGHPGRMESLRGRIKMSSER